MKKNLDVMIKNGTIATNNGLFKADLAIKNGKIAGLFFPNTEKKKVENMIDAKDMLIFPGVIDSHVHFNEPGRENWEGFKTGSMSAAAGGITTIIDMPLNSSPCTINKVEAEKKIKIGEKNSIVDFGLWGGATPNNMEDLEDLNEMGVVAFKSFLCDSGIAEFKNINDGELIDILKRIGRHRSLWGFHAENDSIVSYLTRKAKESNCIDRKSFLDSRPPIAEEEAVNRILFFVKKMNPLCTIHFLHTSLVKNIEEINKLKILGYNVSVETCPHYLTLTDEDFLAIGPIAKCTPPLRSRKEVEDLWRCVKNDLIDVIGSDHSPCVFEEKEKGNNNIWEAWGGISGIQTMLPIIFSEGVIKRKLPISQLINMMSCKPAKLFGLYPQKGSLMPGSDADIVIFNPNKKWIIEKNGLFYKNKYSPFVGKVITGAVEKTLLRGRVIFEKGEITTNFGIGKFVKRCKAYR